MNAADGQQPDLLPAAIGERLRLARRERDIGIEQAAGDTHIPAPVLERIEADAADDIAPVYLRGYVRTYGRYLGLPPAIIDDALVRIDRPDPSPQALFPGTRRHNRVDRWLRMTSYVLASLLIGTLAWQFTHEAIRLSQGEAETVATGDPVAVPEREPSAPSASEPVGASIAALERLRQREVAPGEAAWAALEAGSTEAAVMDEHRISLTTSADSWVEIRDGSGAVLEMDLVRAGSSRQYGGEPPFEVTVGRASAVQLTFDGERVDLVPHAEGEVSRIRLGENAAPASGQG